MRLAWAEDISRIQVHKLADMCRELDEISRDDFDREFGESAGQMRWLAVQHGILYTVRPGKRIVKVCVTTFGKAWARGDI